MAHKIMLCEGGFGFCYEIVPIRRGAKSEFVQTDWDYPATARRFGWTPRRTGGCCHNGTDGTVNCLGCGRTADEFIEEAQRYLDSHIGKVVVERD